MDAYNVKVNGIEHTVQLDPEAAEKAGLTDSDKVGAVEAVQSPDEAVAAADKAAADKAAKTAADKANKAAAPANK